jgi:glycosyltransferase involved in cell wall biosynthesis
MMKVLNVTSSRFYGGPERQMLGLARAARARYETVFASFSEQGRCTDFLSRVSAHEFQAVQLRYDTPRLYRAYRELVELTKNVKARILLCQGYKADSLGCLAARRLGIPVVSVSRGWTSECRRVRFYEWIDKRILSLMDKVVCVSHSHAARIAAVGVALERIEVIPNSIHVDRYEISDAKYRAKLMELFPAAEHPSLKRIVGAAGRLSPEKGFDVLVEAAAEVVKKRSDVGFVLFGDGPSRQALNDQIRRLGIGGRFRLFGFCNELDLYMPQLDMFVQSSYTEGLPNVLLEALAAQVLVVATDVGGTSEVLDGGNYGTLVTPGNYGRLAAKILDVLARRPFMEERTAAGRVWVAGNFTFEKQAESYARLFTDVSNGASAKVSKNADRALHQERLI